MAQPADADSPVRRRVTFSGHVQGVGFRFTACQVAADHPLGGYVRNLPSGQVEVVVEGRPAVLDQFIRRLAERMGGYVSKLDVQESPARNDFEQFEVRF